MLQPQVEFLFYIVLLSRNFLVLLGWDFRAGNSKIKRPSISSRSEVYNVSDSRFAWTWMSVGMTRLCVGEADVSTRPDHSFVSAPSD